MDTITIGVEAWAARDSAEVKETNHLLKLEKILQVRCVSVGALYSLESGSGAISDDQAQSVAQNLLCDAVAEKYIFVGAEKRGACVFVDVWYKPGVTDTIGQSVQKAIMDLNISSVQSVKTGKRYVFEFAKNGARSAKNFSAKILSSFAAKTLFNPLVQECKITA